MVAGGRIQLLVSPKPPVTITGDAGAGGANLDFHVAGVLGDKVGRKTILQGGYRYLHANYRNTQNFVYDIFTSGSSFGAPSISNDV